MQADIASMPEPQPPPPPPLRQETVLFCNGRGGPPACPAFLYVLSHQVGDSKSGPILGLASCSKSTVSPVPVLAGSTVMKVFFFFSVRTNGAVTLRLGRSILEGVLEISHSGIWINHLPCWASWSLAQQSMHGKLLLMHVGYPGRNTQSGGVGCWMFMSGKSPLVALMMTIACQVT